MKTQSLMTSLAALLTGWVLSGCNTVEDGMIGNGGGDGTVENEVTLTADLDAAFAVPEVDTQSDAKGSGNFVVNQKTGAFRGTLVVSDLTARATEAHIHEGEAGIAGNRVLNLEQGSEANEWQIPDGSLLTQFQVSELLAGNYYVDVHTLVNPNGEVRGQLLLDTHEMVLVELDDDNEVPAVLSNAEGRGFVVIDHDERTVDIHAKVTRLNNASAAHVHKGFAGINGDILFELETTAPDTWQTRDAQTLDSSVYQSLLAGELYINVHSSTYPNGELRGQIAPEDVVVVRTELNGSSEVPPIDEPSYGVGYTTLNTETGEIIINLRAYHLTSAATGAHLHEAAVGQIGDVVLSLEQDSGAPNLWQTPENSLLTNSDVATLLNGGLYLSVLTVNNPGGEMRGQIEP